MQYILHRSNNTKIDARFDVSDGAISLHSRGGKIGGSNSRNQEYHEGLVEIFRRLTDAEMIIESVFVDSNAVQHIPIPERTVLSPGEYKEPETSARLVERNAKGVGRVDDGKQGGNSTKKVTIKVSKSPPKDLIIDTLHARPFEKGKRSADRLPTSELQKVTAIDVFNAVEALRSEPSQLGKFEQSTDYDVVLEDGTRLPPKAVFGIAASSALGFDVQPRHFTGGLNTVCFRALEDAGLRIAKKGMVNKFFPDYEALPIEDDRLWVEGDTRIAVHLRRERRAGLAKAKREAFKKKHGKLFCERCHGDPVADYGTKLAEACLEVHHSKTLVSEMEPGHRTKLDDMELLCANCHRLVHREMKG